VPKRLLRRFAARQLPANEPPPKSRDSEYRENDQKKNDEAHCCHLSFRVVSGGWLNQQSVWLSPQPSGSTA
jgi:hypothetical protein